MSDRFSGTASIDLWLTPLDGTDGICGVDLEYDNDFLALTQAAAGKPETQFEAATPPDWRAVREQAETLLSSCRDLRIAMLWVRACINLEGFAALPEGLRLLHGLLDTFWDNLHPLPDPDDGDPYARMNTLAELRELSGVLGDVRRSTLFSARGVGDVQVRQVEVALGLLPARDDEASISRDQLGQMLQAATAQDPSLRAQPSQAMATLKQLTALLNDRAGTEAAPDLKPLQSMLHQLVVVMPAEAPADDGAFDGAGNGHGGTADDDQGAGSTGGGGSTRRGLSGGVHSRDDALRAIDMVCEYLERTEPTSPAPLLLRRARRMINRNFLQLMKDLAPEALADVARVMGVDPDTVQLDD